MKTIAEIIEIPKQYQSGPVVLAALKDLVQHYLALERAFVAETDGHVDVELAKSRFIK